MILTRMMVVALTGAVLMGCTAARGPEAATKSNPDLVFLGTVESIQASPVSQSLANWVVTFRIDRVESGDFYGKTFSFRIHSARKSGLEAGKQYVVEATKTETGYAVYQYQWMNRTHNQAQEDTARELADPQR